MNFMFSPLSLPEPAQFQPNNLVELVKDLSSSGNFTNLEKLKSFPFLRSRNIDEILADIHHGRANKVSRLEWVYCIQNKASWDKENPGKSRATAEAIWNVAVRDSWLSSLLLWRLVLYHNVQAEREQVLAPTLADGFHVFVSQTHDMKSLSIRLVKLLIQEQPSYEVTIVACEHLLTPKELLNSAKLPQGVPAVEKALDFVACHFAKLKPPNDRQVEWLLRCLDEMSLKPQVSAVNDLLTQIPTKVGGSFPKLVDWLRKYYDPRITGERWHQLSDRAKPALREWIGAVNYGDFANLVNRLLQVLQIEGWEQNQLRRRKEFWANYSNRFERIRILLPQTSMNALNHKVFTADIEILATDGSDPTEVCIFDFGEWFVVEFFRGSGSETRLFNQNTRIEQVLFNSARLSIKQIRHLGGERHDHKFLWQVYCEEWLRTKGINPNPGTPRPRIPAEEQKREREWKLKQWNQEIENLEREARDYSDN